MQLKFISNSLLISLVLLCALGYAHASKAIIYKKINSGIHWKNFKRTFSKTYLNSSHEAQKIRTFLNNLDFINEHNKRFNNGTETYYMDINSMSDMTSEEYNEFISKGLNKNELMSKEPNETQTFSRSTIPVSIDWRTQGVVNAIKRQGSCGACSAFSAISSLESAIAIKTGQLPYLSEQNLVDCVYSYDMCPIGGWYTDQWNYIQNKNNGKIAYTAKYKYLSGSTGTWSGVCKYNENYAFQSYLTGYVQVQSKNELALAQTIASVGPVSVAFYASRNFQHYSGGIFIDDLCPSGEVNHAATLVGYGTDNSSGKDYYILRNQWGTTWGSSGYMYFARNNNNMCEIATYAMYPTVNITNSTYEIPASYDYIYSCGSTMGHYWNLMANILLVIIFLSENK